MDIHIRQATISELNMLVEMQVSLWKLLEQSSTRVWRFTEERKKKLIQELEESFSDENSLILIAEDGSKIIGFVGGTVINRTEYLPPIIGMLTRMFVNEEYRRKGVGRSLIQDICRFFRSKQVEKIYLRYVLGNIEGEKFWQDLGFESILVTAGADINTVEKKIAAKPD